MKQSWSEPPQKIRLLDSLCFVFCPCPSPEQQVVISAQIWVLGNSDNCTDVGNSVPELQLTWKIRP